MRARSLIAFFALLALLAASLSLLPQGGTQAASPGSGSVATTTRPEVVVVRLYFHDAAERDRLATEWGAAEVATAGGYLTVWTDRAGYESMLAAGLQTEIDQELTRQANNPNLFGENSPDTFYGGYKTVEEMQTFLTQYATTYPTLATVVDFGDSWCKIHAPCVVNGVAPWNGYDLLALHITNQTIPGPKPVYWYESGIHSREIATPEVAMRYIQWLLDGYANNPDAHWLVDWQDIWVVPMANPDGHHLVEQGGNNPYLQRKNANYTNGCTTFPPGGGQLGTDDNRNFPFLWNCCGGSSGSPCNETYHGTSGGSEPETQATMNQIRLLIPDQRGPNITDAAPLTTTGVYQSMHSNASLNLFPWGFQVTPHAPNDAELRNIGHHMQAGNAYPAGNNYTTGQPPEVLYAVDGDTADWGYGELGAASYTTEVGGSSFFPAYSTIDSSLWPTNQGALVYQGKIARTPYLLSHGPDSSAVATNPMTVTQGTPADLNATINFAWSQNAFSQNVGAAEYYIDTPPWAGGTAVPMTGNFTSPTVPVQATIDTTGLSVGRHLIFVRGRGANQYQGFDTWGPVTATWLWVLPAGGVTATPTTPPATNTPPPTNTSGVPTPSSTTVPATNTPPPTDTAVVPSATPPTAPSNTPPPATNTPGGPTSTPPAATATSTPCSITFTDVHPTDYFYTPVQYLYCHGVISGYADNTFRPYNNTTRSQMVKIVVLGFAIPIATPTGGNYTFTDVPPAFPFFAVIETAASHNIVSGYTCGGPGEPCDPDRRPYFRPFANVTRGQLSKIDVVAAGWTLLNPTTPSFEDVLPSTAFYEYVETAVCHGIISGYTCGGPGEPCDPQNRPYFRQNNDATRGQISKIVYLSITNPNACATVK